MMALNTSLTLAVQKYGWDNFGHKIVERNLSFSEACLEEKRLIRKCHSTDKKIGYNIAPGGNGGHIYKEHPKGMLGKHQTEYEIKVHKIIMSDRSKNPMTNGKVKWGVNRPHPRGMAGKHQSSYHRAVMKKQSGNKNPNHKSLRITFPNGKEEYWPTTKMFVDNVGFYKVYKLVKTNKPYVVNLNNVKRADRAKCKKYLGCIFSH